MIAAGARIAGKGAPSRSLDVVSTRATFCVGFAVEVDVVGGAMVGKRLRMKAT